MPFGYLLAVKEIKDYFQSINDFKVKAVRHHQRDKTFTLCEMQ